MTTNPNTMLAVVLIVVACDLAAHLCVRPVAVATSAALATASGLLWAFSRLLSRSPAVSYKLDLAAAVTAAAAGAFQLP